MLRKWRIVMLAMVVISVSVFLTMKGFSHCQIPCGIYDDAMRINMMKEHITTIEKGMKQIEELMQTDGPPNANQVVRWVNNKDKHADDFTHIVTYYFMAQRLKPVQDKSSQAHKDYLKQLELLHNMIVYSMKAKQTTDLANTKKLRELVDEFSKAYFKQ